MRIWGELKEFTVKHELKPVIGHEFPFANMAEAHALMESRQSMGKIVIHI
jgi:NADPH:quinone reductase-like Zn-dependent oxidoreductase